METTNSVKLLGVHIDKLNFGDRIYEFFNKASIQLNVANRLKKVFGKKQLEEVSKSFIHSVSINYYTLLFGLLAGAKP